MNSMPLFPPAPIQCMDFENVQIESAAGETDVAAAVKPSRGRAEDLGTRPGSGGRKRTVPHTKSYFLILGQ